MNEIRTYTLTPKKDGLERAPLIGPYEGEVPLDARIIYAVIGMGDIGLQHSLGHGAQVTIDAIVPIANVPVMRQFELVNHGCCATHLSPRCNTAWPVKVEAPPGLASGRLYLFAEKA